MPRTAPALRPLGLAAALLTAACAGLEPPARSAPLPGSVAALDRMSPGMCNPEVASVLAGSGVPVESVRELIYGLQYDELSDDIVRYEAWNYLKEQPGAVVVILDRYCFPTQVYTRGGAAFPRIARY